MNRSLRATVVLDDRVGIGTGVGVIEDALALAELPPARIRIVLSNQPFLNQMAAHVRRELLPYVGEAVPLPETNGAAWDDLIVLSSRAVGLLPGAPEAVVCILGHELEHLRIAHQEGMRAYVFSNLVFRHIRAASGGTVNRMTEFPVEVRCDRVGKALAVRRYGRARVDRCIEEMARRAGGRPARYLRYLRRLDPAVDGGGLMPEVVRFAAPYRKRLVRAWMRSLRQDGRGGRRSLVRYLGETAEALDALFDHAPSGAEG